MAVITFDDEKNEVSILLEKTDIVHVRDDNANTITITKGSKFALGRVLVNGPVKLCVVRGER